MNINVIELSVKNLDESIKFYQEALGCEILYKGPTGIGQAASLKCGDMTLSLMQSDKLPVGIIGIGCNAPDGDINAGIEALKANGARVVMEPQKAGKGTIAKLWDPNDISISVIAANLDAEDSGERITHLPNKIK